MYIPGRAVAPSETDSVGAQSYSLPLGVHDSSTRGASARFSRAGSIGRESIRRDSSVVTGRIRRVFDSSTSGPALPLDRANAGRDYDDYFGTHLMTTDKANPLFEFNFVHCTEAMQVSGVASTNVVDE